MSDFSHIRAKKSLGQNFLIDHEALFAITNATDVEGKNVIEVGPGYGALTEYLLEAGVKNLELVEFDEDMVKILEKRKILDWASVAKNIRIHHIDVLKFEPKTENYALIANIPYYITSPILFHFLYAKNFSVPSEMVILMQKEVGEKILANNSKKIQNSYFSLAMWQACENIEKICLVPSSSFQPAPKVDSIVLKFIPKKSRNPEQEQKMLDFWDKCFKHPRKTLAFNLKSANIFSPKILQILEEL